MPRLAFWPPRFRLLFLGQLAYKRYFFRFVCRSIIAEDLVEPHSRFTVGVWMSPRIPGKVGLCLARHQAPINGGDMLFPGDGQRSLKRAAVAASHVFGANHRPVIAL